MYDVSVGNWRSGVACVCAQHEIDGAYRAKMTPLSGIKEIPICCAKHEMKITGRRRTRLNSRWPDEGAEVKRQCDTQRAASYNPRAARDNADKLTCRACAVSRERPMVANRHRTAACHEILSSPSPLCNEK